MNVIWNLVVGSICLGVVLIDLMVLNQFTWITGLNLFAGIFNYYCFIKLRNIDKESKE